MIDMPILGAVLAGGRSSRFGSDKALARLGGATLLDHALASLAAFTPMQVVCGRAEAPATTVADVPAPDLGPLGGICGALTHAQGHGFDAVLTIACDTPLFPDNMVAALLAVQCGFAAEAPTVGLWPARLAGPLRDHLAASGDRSIRRWAASVGAVPVLPGTIVPGANTVAQLDALRSALSTGS